MAVQGLKSDEVIWLRQRENNKSVGLQAGPLKPKHFLQPDYYQLQGERESAERKGAKDGAGRYQVPVAD
jgi:hypothetical protein